MGTLEFQLKLPELWCRQKAATMIQRVSLGYLGRRAAKLKQDEHMTVRPGIRSLQRPCAV